MKRRLLVALVGGATWVAVLASPVLAHGSHDAQALARHLSAGPFNISLWQIYSDAGVVTTPFVIVMFDEGAPASQPTAVTITVNAKPIEARPSLTTPNAWEISEGVVDQDVMTVTITDGAQAWRFDQVVVPPLSTSGLPIKEVVIASILVTLRVIWWVVGRTARAWRKPVGTSISHQVRVEGEFAQ